MPRIGARAESVRIDRHGNGKGLRIMADHDYYMDCGCWSGQADHTCRVGSGWRRPDCRCGAPDDCYCHESCSSDSPDESCESHRAEYAAWMEADHAEAIAENRDRIESARTRAEDDAVTRLTAGKRSRVVRVQAYRADGSVHILTNGGTHVDIRPRDVTHGNTRRAAVALARMILVAVPDVASLQIWDASSGTNVWGIGNGAPDNVGRPWFVAYPNRNRDGDPTPITMVTDMSDIDGSGR